MLLKIRVFLNHSWQGLPNDHQMPDISVFHVVIRYNKCDGIQLGGNRARKRLEMAFGCRDFQLGMMKC